MKLFTDPYTEKAVLSTALIKHDALVDLSSLTDDDFFNENNRLVYQSIMELYKHGESVDILALRSRLVEKGHLEKIGGEYFLADILKESSLINFNYSVRTLKKLTLRRKLNNLSGRINDLVEENGISNEEILNEIEKTIRGIDEINSEEFIDISKLYKGGVDQYDITGNYLPTGFDALDSRLIGLFKSELIILAARPGCGKTALALNIAVNVSKEHNVLFFSLEMSTYQIGLRILSSDAKVDSDLIRRRKLTEEDRKKLHRSMTKLNQLHLTFNESDSLNEIISKIRKYSQTKNLEMVVIDYLQLINVTSQNQRYIQVGEISRRLKGLSRELNIPILCLAQLNRAAELQVPKLSDLRESGDIEQDADVVIFIHKNPEEKGNMVNILFAKNRSGKADARARMIFKKEYTQFYDLDITQDFDKCVESIQF